MQEIVLQTFSTNSANSAASLAAVSAWQIEQKRTLSIAVNRFDTGVLGSSNSARALAAYLSSKGHRVRLLARQPEKLAFLQMPGREQGIVRAEGKIEGEFALAGFGTSAQEFCAESSYIFIATITSAYDEIARRLAPYLNEDHKIILFSAKLGGTLLFEESLRKAGLRFMPSVVETDALFACRVKEAENSIWIRGFKEWTLFSAGRRTATLEQAHIIQSFFPSLSPAENIIQRGLTDFGAVAHAAIAMANMNLISSKTPFRFYYDGVTEETVRLLEGIESEFRNLARAYGAELIAMKDLLNLYYGCDTSSLYAAMTSVPNYRYSMGPDSFEHRFLHEDICSTLVPATALAELAGIRVPLIDALISIISAVTKKNLKAEGRTLEQLGLAGMDAQEVFAYVNS